MKPRYSILLFVIGALVLDRAIGLALERTTSQVMAGGQNPSGVSAINYAIRNKDIDLVIFGSSRAKFHYSPEILQAELGITSVNLARNGAEITFARLIQSELLRHATSAQGFVLQVDPMELWGPRPPRTGVLAPLYGKNAVIDRELRRASRFALLKLSSHTYRYNGEFWRLLADRRAAPPGSGRGFLTLPGTMTRVAEPKGWGSGLSKLANEGIPEHNARLHREFLEAARERDIPVLIVVGPRLRPRLPAANSQYTLAIQYFRQLAANYGAHFRHQSDIEHPEFRDPALYRDWLHLNHEGAAKLTKLLARDLASLGLGHAQQR